MKVVFAVLVTALAVGVGSVQATQLVTGAQISNNSVTGKDIKRGSLGVSDLSAAARRSLRGARGARGPAGAPGATGLTGPKGTTDIFYVDSAVTVVPASSAGTATAACPAGSSATGGGLGFATDVEMMPAEFNTVGVLGFSVIATNPDAVSHELQARVACARR